MKKRTVVLLIVVGIGLFAYFVPVVPDGGPFPMNCQFCPLFVIGSHYYSSLTYAYLGNGAVYFYNSYYFRLGTTFYYP
jgi:hypothetical protein